MGEKNGGSQKKIPSRRGLAEPKFLEINVYLGY